MLDVIHKKFWRKAEWFEHDIFAKETVLAVGIGTYLYAFSI